MRHKKKRAQLNRFTSWRRLTLRSLAINLLIYQSMRTTIDKAKAVRPLAEKLISLARRNTLFAKREAFRLLCSHKLVAYLFKEIGPRFVNRSSGFTRIIHLGNRRGDDARLVLLELTEIKKKEPKKQRKVKEIKSEKEATQEVSKEKVGGETKSITAAAVKEKPPVTRKPTKSFFGGLRKIFKKERDSL